jgi:putative endonuclease
MRGGWLYMMTNQPNGTLYTSVTSNISRRAWEHREGLIDGFTKRYGLKQLVYMERYEDIRDAIQHHVASAGCMWRITIFAASMKP